MNQYSQRITDYILNQYGVSPDCPWEKSPDAYVYRHSDTRKWFGLIILDSRKRDDERSSLIA